MSSGVIDTSPFISSAQVENVLRHLSMKELKQRAGEEKEGRKKVLLD